MQSTALDMEDNTAMEQSTMDTFGAEQSTVSVCEVAHSTKPSPNKDSSRVEPILETMRNTLETSLESSAMKFDAKPRESTSSESDEKVSLMKGFKVEKE